LSRTDLHPDHLLARRRAGLLSPEESAQLDRHASQCATCAFEIAAAQDFDRDLAMPIDPAALAAVTAGVTRSLDGEAPVVRRRTRPVWIGVAAAVAVVAASALAAALTFPRPTPPPPRRPASSALTHAAPRVVSAPAVPPTVVAPEVVVAPAPVAPPVVVASDDGATHLRRHHRRVAAAPDATPGAGERARVLFEQAVAARRGGQHALAASLFEQLQHRYGDSEEASISQIALGRLWLDRLNQPARALAQFESYLAARRGGESREEAMVGRAAALERLGRTASAREAWEAVRDACPGSVSSRRAAVRIDALR
jgi:hypothetical protein